MLEGLDEDQCSEETEHFPEKKRRLSVYQVKSLEKSFEVENKLEPERKVKLAQEIGLQPRQVAVWFQNRRARWKTRNLERDYGVLKASFDSLKHNYDNLKQDNEALLKEVRELKSKQIGETNENKEILDKEGMMTSEHDEANELVKSSLKNDEDAKDINFESFNNKNEVMGVSIFTYFKDGYSDSDSSGVLNEENNNSSPNQALSTSRVLHNQSQENSFLISNGSSSSSASNYNKKDYCLEFSNSSKSILEEAHNAYEPQFVKIEEQIFYSGEDSCSTFFSDDQAPTLHWYTPEVWN